ncbi:universal stress protein [Streptomyces sp. NPDC005202]|uniref:universal stress protein n=1 Tax=Streptomyces sp. NPDC005202 TaxID=3157021 RepID=UPI0033A1CADA
MNHPVLASVDGSARSLSAADWAAPEAALRGVPLCLVHASPPFPGTAVPAPAVDTLHQVGERMLQRAVADLSARHPDIEVRGEHADGAPAAALLAAACRAGLLVVGTRGSGGFGGLAVGSVALRVAAAAACPVVLVPERPAGAFGEGTHGAALPRWWWGSTRTTRSVRRRTSRSRPLRCAEHVSGWSRHGLPLPRPCPPTYRLPRPRNGVPGLRDRHDFVPLSSMIWGVVSPGHW